MPQAVEKLLAEAYRDVAGAVRRLYDLLLPVHAVRRSEKLYGLLGRAVNALLEAARLIHQAAGTQKPDRRKPGGKVGSDGPTGPR